MFVKKKNTIESHVVTIRYYSQLQKAKATRIDQVFTDKSCQERIIRY